CNSLKGGKRWLGNGGKEQVRARTGNCQAGSKQTFVGKPTHMLARAGDGYRRSRPAEDLRKLPNPSLSFRKGLQCPSFPPSISFRKLPFLSRIRFFSRLCGRMEEKKRMLRADPEQGRRTWRAPERSRLAGTRSEAGHADVLEVHRKNSTASFDFVKTILRPGWSGCSFPKGGAGAGVRRVAVVASASDRTSVGRPTHACLAYSDQHARREHQRAANHDLGGRRQRRGVHVAPLNPGDGEEF